MTRNELIKQKSSCYNLIKITAMLLVVVGHVARMHTEYSAIPIFSSSDILGYISKIIYGFHMPLFFLVTGAIFHLCIYDLGKYKNKRSFFTKKAKRTIIPYLFFGILYVSPVVYLLRITDKNIIEYLFKDILLCLNSCHLWYLYYLFIYYLLTYYVFKNKSSILMLCILLVLSLLNIKILSSYATFYFFFMAGFYVNRYYEKIYKILNKSSLIAPLIIIASIAAYIFTNIFNAPQQIIYICGSIMALSILLSLKITPRGKIYEGLIKNSMGIYLFHPMLIYLLYASAKSSITKSILFNIVAIVIVIIISFALTEATRKIKLGFILGEDIQKAKT